MVQTCPLGGGWEGTGLGKTGPAYIGLGYSHTQKMCALCDLPSLAYFTYYTPLEAS